MWAVYSEMRRRGALAGEGLDGAKFRIERLTAELAAKDAEIAALKAGVELGDDRLTSTERPTTSAPADNVVKLPAPPAPAADVVDLRASRANGAGGSAGFRVGPPDEPWRGY
jgi:hypothetical protein